MNNFKTTTDIIYNNHTKKDIIIVHISDIHFSSLTKEKVLIKLKEEIAKLKPDYIMITGDLIDIPDITKNNEKIIELLTFLSNIAKISKVFISLGNHDIISEEDYIFFNKLDDLYNIYVLNNKSYQDDYIYISGFTLPNEYYYNVTKKESSEILIKCLKKHPELISKLPNNLPKIALIHSPIKIVQKEVLSIMQEYDVILSGHTHGGMVPDLLKTLFKGNAGIIAPNKSFFPKIAQGKIEKEINNKKITIIINGAITKLSKRSGSIFSNLNFVYNKSINKIIIRKKRGIKYE